MGIVLRIDPLSVSSLFFCKINQAAAFLRKYSGNTTSLRHKDAAMICLPGDFLVAEKISHSLPHRNPFHDASVIAGNLLSDFEFLGIIDHHLHPKNRTGFIVHFQPVLFDTMFNPCPGNSCARAPVLHVRNDLAAEITGQLSSKEAHDILGAKAQGAMAQQTCEESP